MKVWQATGATVLAAAVVAALFAWSEYPREAIYMAGIFVLAAALWITEALPLFVTALVVIGAQVVALANPGGWPLLGFSDAAASPTAQGIIAAAADPVLLLFFGGLMLARAAEVTDAGRVVSTALLGPFGQRPPALLLGVMIVTATFSMWMSNTAAAAMMLALIAPRLEHLSLTDPSRKALVLGVAFAANLGGLGTPIASPPNALAIGYLQKAGHAVGFLDWMLVAVPLLAGLLIITWLLLWRTFPPEQAIAAFPVERVPLTRRGGLVGATFFITVLLWITAGWHGVPAAVVALVPVVALTASGILNDRDVNSLDWTILILIAGGVSLGAGMQTSGLDAIVAGWLPLDAGENPRATAAILVTAVLVLGTFMSNTAAANLLLPVAISAGLLSGSGSVLVELAMSIALAASMGMALPISTPPNALAYARGAVTTRDMAPVGLTIGIVAAVLIVGLGAIVMRFWKIS